MNKRILMIGLLAITTFSSLVNANELANKVGSSNNIPINYSSEPNFLAEVGVSLIKPNFLKYSGPIKNVIRNEKGAIDSIVVETSTPNELTPNNILFELSSDVIIFNDIEKEQIHENILVEGKIVDVFFNSDIELDIVEANLIEPIVIVSNELKSFVTMMTIDKNLTSHDNKIKIKISDETKIFNQYGEEILKEDILDKDLIVFHEELLTISLPIETLAKKIFIVQEVDKPIIESDFGTYSVKIDGKIINLSNVIYSERRTLKDPSKNSNKMMPVREIFENLGYKVNWIKGEPSIEITKDDMLIYLPYKTYLGYARVVQNNGVSYVSHIFFEDFLQMSVDFNF